MGLSSACGFGADHHVESKQQHQAQNAQGARTTVSLQPPHAAPGAVWPSPRFYHALAWTLRLCAEPRMTPPPLAPPPLTAAAAHRCCRSQGCAPQEWAPGEEEGLCAACQGLPQEGGHHQGAVRFGAVRCGAVRQPPASQPQNPLEKREKREASGVAAATAGAPLSRPLVTEPLPALPSPRPPPSCCSNCGARRRSATPMSFTLAWSGRAPRMGCTRRPPRRPTSTARRSCA